MNALSVRLVAVAVMSLLASQAFGQSTPRATPKKQTGWYVGGSGGAGGYKTGYERTAATIFSTGATNATVTADAKENMWKAYLGYRFSPNFSWEMGYRNFGHPSYVATVSAPVVTTFQRNFSAEGWGGDVVYWMPLGDTFSAFGKIGALYVSTRAGAADPGGGLTPLSAESSRKLNWSWGLGAEYDFRNNFAARIEYETVLKVGDDAKFGTADVVMWSLGLNYKY